MADARPLGAVQVGVISNPTARRNRTNPAILRALAGHPNIPVVLYRGGDGELARQLAGPALRGISDLVIDGGDGTVMAAISAALEVSGSAAPPRFVLAPSGTTNLIARQLGAKGSRPTLIERLLRAVPESLEASTIAHAPIQVARGGGLPRLYGFVLGAAAFRNATLLSQGLLGHLGLTCGAAIAAGIAASAWHSACSANRASFLAGEPLRVDVDGTALPDDRFFLLLVSALSGFMLGLKPFWGSGPGALRCLSIAAPPRRLLAALPRVLFGRPAAWMHGAGYRSAQVSNLTLTTRQAFTLDGEVVQPGLAGRVEISTGPRLRFLQLA